MTEPAFTITRPVAGDDRCGFRPAGRDQCKRHGTTAVAGVEAGLCRQHARIVATEPGASGYIRELPVGVDAIVADLALATTVADIDRCRSAMRRQIDVCGDRDLGLKPELKSALAAARARVNRSR